MTLKEYFRARLMEERKKQPTKKQPTSPEQATSEFNIQQFDRHLAHLEAAIGYHMGRKPGWSDTHGNVSQDDIDRKVADLQRIYDVYSERHERAKQNHANGNFAANRDHYILGGDYFN